MRSLKDLREKTLTPAEKKKREEIAKAMERDNPGMDMSKKMAIATATAKRVAEEQKLDESIYASDYNVGHEKSPFGGHRPHVTHKKTGRTMYLGATSYKKPEHAKGHAAAYLNGYQALGDKHADRKAREYATQNQKHQYVKESAEVDEMKVNKPYMAYRRLKKKLSGPNHYNVKLGDNKPEQKVQGKDKPSAARAAQNRFPDSPKVLSVTRNESVDVSEISLDMLTKKISNTGMATTKKANKMDKTKKDLKALKARLAGKPVLAKESPENDEPASPDEGSMAMKQLEFIEYAAEEMMDHIKAGKPFPEWMQNKLTKAHTTIEGLHSSLGEHGGDDEDEMKEATEISELSPQTLGKYTSAAKKDLDWKKGLWDRTGKRANKRYRDMENREKGIKTAINKLTKEEVANEALSNNMRLISKIKNSGVVKTGSMAKDTKPAPKNEGINTADKKPEKFVRPDGKVGIRMVPVDKKIVDKDA